MSDLPVAAGFAAAANTMLQRVAARQPLLVQLKLTNPALYDALTGASLAAVLQLLNGSQGPVTPEPPRDHPQYPLV